MDVNPGFSAEEKSGGYSSDLMHLVTPGDIITEDIGFMRYNLVFIKL